MRRQGEAFRAAIERSRVLLQERRASLPDSPVEESPMFQPPTPEPVAPVEHRHTSSTDPPPGVARPVARTGVVRAVKTPKKPKKGK